MNSGSTLRILIRWLSVFTVATVLAACAVGVVQHSFGFNTSYDNQDAEVLDYRYGNSKLPVRAPVEAVKKGRTFGGNVVTGPMLRGDYLYVKWRNKRTGELFEDTVDLRLRLPRDIENHKVFFMIYGPQLYVYLISPETRELKTRPVGPSVYNAQKTLQIYPDLPNQ